ncbi:flagellar hook assembly protein FlgD [Pandoraea pnomenusa]|uniref:flagellar hook assembly protein FlgD n=1 Tax=Pandoraea pnomenusa TaxID=93220 RepID=UPI0011470E15|nr:flagellar hook capping FlgD N-terminal domain-containing protein [Pandoraea pnomenusa]QDH60158.1 flagellar hook capping protein [Pandoraea pnomenusa]
MAVGSSSSIDSTTLQSSSLGMQDFLKILLTQLTYQDPLKPMDNQQFMAQMAQFTTLEQTQQLNDKIGQLISTQATLQSVGLIGKTVDASTSSGSVTGTVTALTLDQNTPQLTIKTTTGATLTGISLAQLTAVR